MTHVTARHTAVTGALVLALWGVSWGMSYVELGRWSLAVALGIAGAKAVLVALFFMELVTERAPFNFAVLSALTMVAILIAFTVGDVMTRAEPPLSPPPVTYTLQDPYTVAP